MSRGSTATSGACGAFWLILLFMAVVSQSHIDAGGFGLFGFPILAFLYAVLRVAGSKRSPDQVAQLRERVARLEGARGSEREI